MNYYPKIFLVLGTVFGTIAAFFILVGVLSQDTLSNQTYTVLSLAILSFCMSYLYPHLKQKSDRMKLIKQKAMYYSFFAMMAYLLLFLLTLQFNMISLNVLDLITILIALNISTVFLAMVILARIY